MIFVSNYWHQLNINCYQSLNKHGQEKGISEIARHCYYTFTDLYDGWIDGAIKNLSDIENININAQLFKKQNDLSHRESIFYNYLCFLLYYNLKRGSYFKIFR